MFSLENAMQNRILGKDNIIYHGTSVEGLIEIIKSGRFESPSYFAWVKKRLIPSFDEEKQQELQTLFTKFDFEDSECSLRAAYDYSKQYAKSKSLVDHLRYKQGLGDVMDKFEEVEFHTTFYNDLETLNNYCVDYLIEIAKPFGYTEEDIRTRINQASKRNGIMIGINKEFFTGKIKKDFSWDLIELVYPKETDNETSGMDTKYINSIYISTAAERREVLAALDTVK
jgi:hypothetical protein